MSVGRRIEVGESAGGRESRLRRLESVLRMRYVGSECRLERGVRVG